MRYFKDVTLRSFSPVLQVLWSIPIVLGSMPIVSSTNISHDYCQVIPLQPSIFTSVNTAQARMKGLKCDDTRRRTGGEVKGKLANGVGSQYSSHYLGIWCIQHYYR